MKKIKALILILAVTLGLNVYAATTTHIYNNNHQIASTEKTYLTVNPLDIVTRPNFYLNKNVKIRAKFDKFATLGLDYKPAMRIS